MTVYAFAPIGFDGELVTVEVDLRRGIPSVDLVGLPDGAVKEARERMRAAIRNSGFQFPLDRLLISLAPAGIRKEGASFDLAMAIAVLAASGQVPDSDASLMALGELELSGRIRPVSGVLPAVAAGLRAGVPRFIVPVENISEARALAGDRAAPIAGLADCVDLASGLRAAYEPGSFPAAARPDESPAPSGDSEAPAAPNGDEPCDMADLRGQPRLRRAMEIAAAGGHHALLFGPPGVGKTMAARRLVGLLPDLDDDDAIAVTTLHSLAGTLPDRACLIRRPPFRSPHHGASAEGIVGGGRSWKPGEISLAHAGVLLIDEAPEFRSDVLQALREPLEAGKVTIVRADRVVSYPSRFMLVASCNPCPCGNLGRKGAVCLCSADEIRRYWKRLGGPLLDRIDIRLPVWPATPEELSSGPGETSAAIRTRVAAARAVQRARFASSSCKLNGRMGVGAIDAFCRLGCEAEARLTEMAAKTGFSSRACHSTLRVARTIADLAGMDDIEREHIDEAITLRRYGDDDIFWMIP